MSLVNVFKTSLFKTTTLTAAINATETPPQRIAQLGLFEEQGVPTTSVVIERKNSRLDIAPVLPRGADPTPMKDPTRQGVSLIIPHVPVRDRLMADELQDVREFGSEDQLVGIESARDEKLQTIDDTLTVTEEYHRLGAIQGLVLDKDGSVLLDLYDEFEVTEPTTIEIDLDRTGWTAEKSGLLRAQFSGLRTQMRQVLENKPVRGVWAPCGEDIYEQIANHPEVRETYLATMEAKDLRGDPTESFSYGGVLWEKYPGYGDVEMDADECRFIPMGIPGLFISRYAPAPWFSAVNRKGLPRYAMATLDPTGEKWIDLEGQTNGLHICTRPEALIPGRIAP